MTDLAHRPPLSRGACLVALGVTALLLSAAGRYGIFRDEFYYLMCADHPAWGYVDHPPLAMFFLTVWKSIFGKSMIALRIPPALLGGFTALGAAFLAREMRGRAAAQILAAITAGLMPGVLALGSFYSMNSFDVAFWVLVAWIVCRLLDPTADRRWWWALGVAFGLGLMNKYSIVFLGVGLGVGILFSPLRRELLSETRLGGTLLVVLIVLPHFVWQVLHDFPTIEFIRNAHNLKNVAMSPAVFWREQLLMAHPLYTPVWAVGLLALLFAPLFRTWRTVGIAFVVVGLWLTLSHAKPYYLVPAYPMVMAAGAVAITVWLGRWRFSRVAIAALSVLLAIGGLGIAPLAIPLLEPEAYVRYEQKLGLRPAHSEHQEIGELPQHFADRFGWPELARTVRDVVARLPESERPRTLVVANNYGECGAINYWGLPEGVRPAVSGHNSCFLWWPADFAPEVVVVVGGSREDAEQYFETVELGAVHRTRWAMPYERELSIWVCRGWKVDPALAREKARFAI
jgi:hypothetical protein